MPRTQTGQAPSLLTFLFLLRGRVIYFDTRPRFQGTQNLVAAGDDFVTLLHSLGDLDIRGPADAGIHRNEFGFLLADHEHALHFFVVFRLRCFRRSAGGRFHAALAQIFGHEIRLRADRERLNRNAEHAAADRGRNFGGRGESRAQVRWRIGERYDDFEVFRFLARRSGLRGRNTGRAHDRVVADFADDAVEDFVRNGVDGHFRGLAETNVDDVGLVHLHLGRDHRHVG